MLDLDLPIQNWLGAGVSPGICLVSLLLGILILVHLLLFPLTHRAPLLWDSGKKG